MKKWFFGVILILLLSYEAVQQKSELANDNQRNEKRMINVTKDQIYQGNLLLVNKKYPVHQEGVVSDVIHLFQHKELVKGFRLKDSTIRLSRGDEQSQLYQEMGANYALPSGHSEHNLGLSMDIGSTLMEMDQAPEGKWLKANAWKYGFILRYPKTKRL